MSADWIEGRFEGVYTGRNLGAAGRSAQRYALELKSGSVTESRSCAAPSDAPGAEAEDEIRQELLEGIVIPLDPDAAGEEARARSLYDLRIRDFELSHPAEAKGRAYGTVRGTILARLTPPDPAAQGEAGEQVAPAAETEPDGEVTDPLPPAMRRHGSEVVGPNGSAAWAHIRLALALLAVAMGATALSLACGARTGVIFAAPIAGALVLRRVSNAAAQNTPGAWSFCVVGLQWAVLAMLALGAGLGCGQASLSELALLGAPVFISGLVTSRWPLVLCSVVFTAVLCTECAGGVGCANETATSPDAAAVAPAAPLTAVTEEALAGTPGSPGAAHAVPSSAAAANAARSGNTPGGAPTAPTATDRSQAAPGLAHAAAPRTDANGRWPVMPASSTAGAPAATGRAAAATAAGAAAAPAAGASSAATSGGWVAAEDAKSLQHVALISIEQANREPSTFFDGGGNRRVYLPTDPMFDANGATISSDGALQLARLAALVSARPRQPVTLEVHTDAGDGTGSLSNLRAAALQRWLADRGHLQDEQFEVVAVGSGRPLVPPDGSHAAQQPNRRVEVRLR